MHPVVQQGHYQESQTGEQGCIEDEFSCQGVRYRTAGYLHQLRRLFVFHLRSERVDQHYNADQLQYCGQDFPTRPSLTIPSGKTTSATFKTINGKKLNLKKSYKVYVVAVRKKERKTSALLCLSTRLGGMAADCTEDQLNALTNFGYKVGLAFQIIDDILDVTQSTEKLGKTAGKDEKKQKATYPAVVGLEKSKQLATELTKEAFDSLQIFNGKAIILEALAEKLLNRDH